MVRGDRYGRNAIGFLTGRPRLIQYNAITTSETQRATTCWRLCTPNVGGILGRRPEWVWGLPTVC